MLPDVNVLVAAYRADHPHHKAADEWLKKTLKDAKGGQKLVLAMSVIGAFLRLVTNSKIFPNPAPCDHAVDFVDWLLEDANVRLVGLTVEWPHLRKLVLDNQLTTNKIPDAQLAALSISLSEPFVTFDKGFRQLLPRSLLVLLTPAP